MLELANERCPFALKTKKVFKDEQNLYFVSELCPFGTLDELANNFPDNKLPVDVARYYAAQLIVFLRNLHRLGVVHRDLKPENVLLSSTMHLQVIDFGDAKYLDDSKNEKFQIDKDPLEELEDEEYLEVMPGEEGKTEEP